jgi:hypothetical protein
MYIGGGVKCTKKKGGYLSLSEESVVHIFILFSKVEMTFDKRKSNHEK